MSNLLDVLRSSRSPATASPRGEVRSGFGDWLDSFGFGGQQYQLNQTWSSTSGESIGNGFTSYVNSAYKSNGVVFACILARQLLFSEARFQFRRLTNGRPGDLFGTADLGVLERPWTGGTTGELLARMEQDVSLAGNFYGARRGGPRGEPSIRRLRPDWVTIVSGSHDDPANPGEAIDAEVIGYVYQPGGGTSKKKPTILLPDEVCHYSPLPDPGANFRGMSWLTPVLREITGDSYATEHKIKFFENGATPNMVVSYDPSVTREAFEAFKAQMDAAHQGVWNAYKTLYLGGGADVTVVGADFKQMDFKVTQGAGETRIAAAAGVPPIVVGLSEGLDASTYSNYGQARRKFADHWARPHWRMAAASLASIVNVPVGAELWYDARDISFLQEDEKDAAEIQGRRAQTIKALCDAGFKPESVIAAVNADDMALLVHSGLYSVQLIPPGTMGALMPAQKNSNGDGLGAVRERKVFRDENGLITHIQELSVDGSG